MYGSIRQLVGHGGHRRQLKPRFTDGLDRIIERRRLIDAHLVHEPLHFLQRAAARLLAARHEAVARQRQLELIAVPVCKCQTVKQVADRGTIASDAQAVTGHLDNLVKTLQTRQHVNQRKMRLHGRARQIVKAAHLGQRALKIFLFGVKAANLVLGKVQRIGRAQNAHGAILLHHRQHHAY